jgi:hypothetical protein
MTAVLAGAGDIGDCGNDGGRHAEATAKLLDKMPDATVFAAGDLAYFDGSAERFANCYEGRWGRHRSRTRPAPGNHEYVSSGANPYYSYFGAASGAFGFGFYSYDLGNWHIISLNSNIPDAPGSAQWQWLREDLNENNLHRCTLAYWHHPRFSSSMSGGGFMADAWRLLYENGVDVVITAHDHGYERFAPLDGEGRRDPNGIRQFVVGTGGAPPYMFQALKPGSETHISTYGVIRLTLRESSYEWTFYQAEPEAALDTGGDRCH